MSTDSFGNWTDLGNLSPNTVDWLEIPGEVASSKVFRFVFSLNWSQWEDERSLRFKSFGILKEEYQPVGAGVPTPNTTKKRLRIKPQRDPLLVELNPIPLDFSGGNFSRKLLIKRVYWSPQNWATTRPDLDLPWSVFVQRLD